MRVLVWTFLGALLVVSTPVIAKDKTLKPKKADKRNTLWILAVGIDAYQDDYWNDLKFAEQDAKNFVKTLKSKSSLKVRAVVITSAQARSKRIQAVLKNMRRKMKRSDYFIGYFSGHGSLVRGRGAQLKKILVLHDSKKESLSQSGYSHEKLVDLVEGLPAAKKSLIFATCHSGVGKSKLSPEVRQLLASNKGELPSLEKVSEGMVILSAASKSETARESGKLGGDIYTHFLLKGLDLFDRNKDGSVSLLEAHDYARIKTYQFSNGRQRPSLIVRAIGDADIPLTGERRDASVAVLEGYDEELAGLVVEVNGGEKGELPLAFPLNQQKSTITLYEQGGQEKLASYRVESRPGEIISIKDLAKPAPYFIQGMYVNGSWTDERVAKLTGDDFSNSFRISGGLQNETLRGGIFFTFAKDDNREAVSSISFESKYQQFGVQVDYLVPLGRSFKATAGMRLTSENYSLKVQDQADGDFVDKSSSVILPYLSLGVAVDVHQAKGEFGLNYNYSANGKYDFDEIGELEADRREFLLYFQFGLGGKAERI